MARRPNLFSTLVRIERAAVRSHHTAVRAQAQAQARSHRQAVQAQKAYERARLAGEKERKRLYVEMRSSEVDLRNASLEEQVSDLNSLLPAALGVDPYYDLCRLEEHPKLPGFGPGALAVAEEAPCLESYLPKSFSRLQALVPGARRKHAEATDDAKRRYAEDLERHGAKERNRLSLLATKRAEHETQIAAIMAAAAARNREVATLRSNFGQGEPEAVCAYFSLVLESSNHPESFPSKVELGYLSENKELVVELELPPFAAVPTVGSYKYVKVKDEIVESPRPLNQRKAIYGEVIAQIVLRTLHEIFVSDRLGLVEVVVLNGYVHAIDPTVGREVRPCVATLRATREHFQSIDLKRIEPQACLKGLNALVSKSPSELAPVRPVLELDRNDPRFVTEADVLSDLDSRPNLMELTPSEFESLITNLFTKIGLETRQTQASRDGGVDCVAFDPRPIFGGKVVIQAKRYRHTVPVSAIRDLFGTVQNEGASKGILVTTSGFGPATFAFAEGKPLELLSGGHLLYLLAQHAGIEAKIEMPDSWRDAVPDSPGEQ
jgi:restriction system protein